MTGTPASQTPVRSWRDNAPLYAIAAILTAVFVLLALAPGRTEVSSRLRTGDTAGLAAGQTATPSLAALPADADDDAVAWSRLSPDAARARNAATPIIANALSAVRPFAFAGNDADRERATGCLALAAIAEAGGGDADQRAVIQVVLNRVRHPAFSSTVCGVVFEGSQRATGCQFSFTCDGSLARSYSAAAMRAARQRATEALGGYVHAPVGNATHYHADYVWPWWSPQLDKIAVVGLHQFYRWRGFWGTPQALSSPYRGAEPDPFALRTTAAAIPRPAMIAPTLVDEGAAIRTITPGEGGTPRIVERPLVSSAPGPAAPSDPSAHFVRVARGEDPAAILERARALCSGTGYCQVYGWSEAEAIPSALPLTADARRALRFSFLPSRSGNGEVVYFDCGVFPDVATSSGPGTCLPRARP